MNISFLNCYLEVPGYFHFKESYSFKKFQRQYLNKLAFLLMLTLVFMLSGCSMIGYMIGADADSDPEIPSEVNKIKKGKEYRFTTLDGETFQGEFVSIIRMDEDKYSAQYTEKKDPLLEAQYLPSIGDTISVDSRIVGKKQAVFFGFDHQSTYLKYIPSDSKYATTLSNKHSFSILSATGEKITSAGIRRLISERRVAVMSQFYIGSNNDAVKISLDNVYKVEIQGRRNGRVTGFLIGFAIDTGIIIALVQSNFPFGNESLFSN